MILFSVLGTACLFYGLFVIQGTISFWTIETLELMNITTYGGVETGQFPMSIYKPGFRIFFTLFIPLACVGYYPMAIMLEHEALPLWLGLLFPFAGMLFLYLACRIWRLGVSKYQSTGA
jgi:ABC-2 type transport system permease protein